MAIKANLIALHDQHPDWTARQLASAAQCDRTTVYSVATACGLNLRRPSRVIKRALTGAESPSAVRSFRLRERQRLGVHIVTVEVNAGHVATLQRLGFLAGNDKRAIATAVREYMSVGLAADEVDAST